jgi:hypothetical protein
LVRTRTRPSSEEGKEEVSKFPINTICGLSS